MARSRKNKLFNLFRDDFKITFFYKPTMIDDDVFYYIILDDLIKLKIKMIHGAIVIDDIIPVSTAYMANIYDSLIELFTKQTDFTVLVSLTGNTSAFSSSCIKYEAPIIEDERFLTIHKNVYEKLKEYYKEDISKYGFYLLAVRDIPDGEVVDEQTIEAGKVPLIDKVIGKFKEKYQDGFSLNTETDWERGRTAEINGIRCRFTFDDSTNTIGIRDVNCNNIRSYFDLVTLCDVLELYCRKGNIIFYDIRSPQLNDICESKGYRFLSQTKQRMISFNQKYTQMSFGDYKVEIV